MDLHPTGLAAITGLGEPLRHTGTVVCVAAAHFTALPLLHFLEERAGFSTKAAGFLLSQGVGISVYWFWAILLHVLDTLVQSGTYPFLARFKLRPNAPEPSFRSLVPSCLLNQAQTVCLAGLLFLIIFPQCLSAEPVTVWSTFLWIAIYLAIADVEFAVSHRIMHSNPAVYRAIHKFHHLTFGTTAVSAIAMHPLDYLFEGTLVLLLPTVLCGVHFQTGVAYGALASFNSIITHSGWDVPFFASPHPHYLHHSKQNVNFGILVSDIVCGTEDGQRGVLLSEAPRG